MSCLINQRRIDMKFKSGLLALSLVTSVFAQANIDQMSGYYKQIFSSQSVKKETGRLSVFDSDGDQEIQVFMQLTDARGRVCEVNEIFEDRNGFFELNYFDKKLDKACNLSLFRTPKGRLILNENSTPGACQDLCLDQDAEIGTRVFISE